ncbi:MAG: carboxypeptidase regulatory-like domain-containing protein [Ruminococcus sp.]|nr:carboxypeptidase regulatory-like domain-containing protein [Ruminococcus sp.]
MDRNEFDKYKSEMMKMYGKSNSKNTFENEIVSSDITINEENDFKSLETHEIDENSADDTAYSSHIDEENSQQDNVENDYNNRYPEPDLSDFEIIDAEDNTTDNRPPEYFSEESLGSGTGYILVNVRTGDESSAVEGASVLITAIVEGNRVIVASALTDQNGTAGKIRVPAPDISHSQQPAADRRPYNLFDVSVTARGFFNARSVDVPVFSGITSVQNFSMIPVPLMMGESSETVTVYNQEPSFDRAISREV